MALATTQNSERNARVAVNDALHQSMKIEAAKESRPIQAVYDEAANMYLALKRGDIIIVHRDAAGSN